MSWTPVVTVTIAGTDYTGDTIDLIQLTRGRNNIYTSVQPAIASITLLDKTGAGIVPAVADNVTVTLQNSAGQPVTLFVGEVSDWSTRIYDSGIMNQPAATIRITAISTLANLFRRQVFADGQPVQRDGERILDILLDSSALPWEEAPGIWDDYTNQTWETVDPAIDFNIVDTPGQYDVEALPAFDGGYTAGSIAGETGLSGGGLVYETADGRVGYADFLRRFNNSQDGYLMIPADKITASQVSTSSQIADLTNDVIVAFAGGEVQRTDPDSIQQYTRRTQRLQTVLNNAGDAETFGDRYLAGHSQPFIVFESANIRLDQNVDAQLLDALIGIEINDAVEIDGLPATLGLTAFGGFVEGVLFSIDPFRTDLQLLVSSANLSLGPAFWASLPSIAWQDVDQDLQWSQAGSI